MGEMVEPGIYRHYKGGLYEVFFEAKHTETGEWVVAYRNIEHGTYYVRPSQMFKALVKLNGETVNRFVKEQDE